MAATPKFLLFMRKRVYSLFVHLLFYHYCHDSGARASASEDLEEVFSRPRWFQGI